MICKLLLSFLLSGVIGFLLIWLISIDGKLSPFYLLSIMVMSFGLGFGISSCIFFVSTMLLGHPSIKCVFITEIALIIALSLIIVYKIVIRNYPIFTKLVHAEYKLPNVECFLLIIFLSEFLLGLSIFIFASLKWPHGGWDAWAIWNLRARLLFRSTNFPWGFTDVLGWSHPDYPLLISGTIARCWEYIGADTVAVPIIISMFFTFGTVLLVVSALSLLRSKSQGLLAGIVLLGSTFFIFSGTNQMADIPLSFFFLATIVVFFLQGNSSPGNYRLFILAGMMAGFSAWTKNEGLLFLIVIVVSRWMVCIKKVRWKSHLKETLYFIIGLSPILLIIFCFKSQIASQNDLLSAQGLQFTLEKILNAQRYVQTFKAFALNLSHLGSHSLILTFLLIIYCLTFGVSFEKKDDLNIKTNILVITLMLVGYFFVFITSPWDLSWHLSNSLDRLLLQLWPTCIFTYCMIVRAPDLTFGRKQSCEGSPVTG